MVAAGIGALVVNSAQARGAIQVQAVVIAHAGQGEYPRLLVEAFDDAFFLQAFGNVLRRLATFELVDYANTNKIVQACFNWQRATTGVAGRHQLALCVDSAGPECARASKGHSRSGQWPH